MKPHTRATMTKKPKPLTDLSQVYLQMMQDDPDHTAESSKMRAAGHCNPQNNFPYWNGLQPLLDRWLVRPVRRGLYQLVETPK